MNNVYSLKKCREWFICDAKSGFSGNEVWGIGLAKRVIICDNGFNKIIVESKI